VGFGRHSDQPIARKVAGLKSAREHRRVTGTGTQCVSIPHYHPGASPHPAVRASLSVIGDGAHAEVVRPWCASGPRRQPWSAGSWRYRSITSTGTCSISIPTYRPGTPHPMLAALARDPTVSPTHVTNPPACAAPAARSPQTTACRSVSRSGARSARGRWRRDRSGDVEGRQIRDRPNRTGRIWQNSKPDEEPSDALVGASTTRCFGSNAPTRECAALVTDRKQLAELRRKR
jgi:hypothetical protein